MPRWSHQPSRKPRKILRKPLQTKNSVAVDLNEFDGDDDVEVGWYAGDSDVAGCDGDVQMVEGSGDG